MTVRVWFGVFALLLVWFTGCLSDEGNLKSVGSSWFGGPARTRAAWIKKAPKATEATALRVNAVGQKIVAANPVIGHQVAFMTAGVPQTEIFHLADGGSRAIWITEGLVKECKTEGELAAILSQELGKMVSEDIAKSRPLRNLPPPPPMASPRIGNDIGDSLGGADRTDYLIASRMEKDRRNFEKSFQAPPPPENLARAYLQKAGFNPADLDTVKPLLRKAEKNEDVERQMSGKLLR